MIPRSSEAWRGIPLTDLSKAAPRITTEEVLKDVGVCPFTGTAGLRNLRRSRPLWPRLPLDRLPSLLSQQTNNARVKVFVWQATAKHRRPSKSNVSKEPNVPEIGVPDRP